MRARGVLLVLFGVFTAVHVVGVLFWSPLLPAAPLLAWAALVVYAALAAREAPPAVRWPLFAGLAVFGIPAFLAWQADSSGSDGLVWMVSDFGRHDDPERWTETLREAAPLLVVCGLFAGATLVAHVRARHPGWTVAGRSIVVIGGALAAGTVVVQLWSLSRPLTGYGWRLPVTVLVVLAAFVAAVLAAGAATAHGRGGWLAAAGLATLALLALDRLDAMLFALPLFQASVRDGVWAIGYLGETQAVSVLGASWSYLDGGVRVAAQFAAVGAVTAGLALIRYAATPARS